MSGFSLAERLRAGNFSLKEARTLAKVSHSKIYQDLARGLIGVRKRGRSSEIPGPIVERYINQCPIDDLVPLFPGLIVGRIPSPRLIGGKHGRPRKRPIEEAPPCLT